VIRSVTRVDDVRAAGFIDLRACTGGSIVGPARDKRIIATEACAYRRAARRFKTAIRKRRSKRQRAGTDQSNTNRKGDSKQGMPPWFLRNQTLGPVRFSC